MIRELLKATAALLSKLSVISDDLFFIWTAECVLKQYQLI